MGTPKKAPSKAAKKAEFTKLKNLYKEELEIIKIQKATGNEVTIRYEGNEHTFVFRDGYVAKVANQYFLSRDDYAFLLRFAEDIMRAVFNGYKNGKRRKPKKPDPQSQPRLNF